VDKELLFKPRLAEAEVEIPGVGTVRVRALSRAEAMVVSGVNGAAAMERKTLHLGMVDPQLTEAEVGQWQKAAPAGDLQIVNQRIAELSGMVEGSDKATFPGDGDGPEPGV
jgi:hypothetical protein